MRGEKGQKNNNSKQEVKSKFNENQLKLKIKEEKKKNKEEKKVKKLHAKLNRINEKKKIREQKENQKKLSNMGGTEQPKIEQKRLMEFAFSILISAAVAFLLGALVSEVPIDNSEHWLFFSFIIVICTIGFICYIFDSFPTGKYVVFKTFLIISSTMTIFGFARFYSFFIELKKPEVAITENSLGINYYTFVTFFTLSGIILVIQGLIEFRERYQIDGRYGRAGLLIFSGIVLLIIIGGFLTFIPLAGLI